MNLWGRLGISVAIVATFCIVMTEVLQSTAYYEMYKWYICAAFLGIGSVLWFVGRFLNRKLRGPAHKSTPLTVERDNEAGDEDAGPPLLLNLAYWVLILVLFGIIIIFIVPLNEIPAMVVAARTNEVKTVKPEPTNVLPKEVEVPAVVATTNPFPPLKLQGIAHHLPDSSVLINGRTYFVGDVVQDAKVVAIQESSTTLEWNGQFKVLVLGK